MDRLRYIPAKLIMTDEAVNKLTTHPSFRRRVTSEGKHAPSSLILTLGLDHYHFLRIIAHRLDDGRWRVSCIDCNLPGHLYGHNARPIRTDHDLALALTRVMYFVSLVLEPDCHGRIIPGVAVRSRRPQGSTEFDPAQRTEHSPHAPTTKNTAH